MLSGALTSDRRRSPARSPGSRRRLRTKSPAATSSSSDSATSATTSTFAKIEPARALDPCRPRRPCSAGTSVGRDARSAGARPKTRPVDDRQREREEQHARIDRELERDGQRAGWRRRRAEAAGDEPREHQARRRRRPARAARSRSGTAAPAASGWRRSPGAPRSRAAAHAARDSSRLATLAHAISSTAPTMASSSRATGTIWARWPGMSSIDRARWRSAMLGRGRIALRDRAIVGERGERRFDLRLRRRRASTGRSRRARCCRGRFSRSGFISPE